jgi:hypothetical protein
MKPVDLLLHLEAYIALESALGFSLRAWESLLRDFVAFVEVSGIRGLISAQIALDWACSASEHCGISGKAARLSIARRFLFYLSAVIPGIEVPSATLLARPRRQEAVSVLRRGDKPSVKGRFVIGTPSIAATSHAFDVIGPAGKLRASNKRSLEPYSKGRLAEPRSPATGYSPDEVSQIAISPNSRNCS